MKKLRSLGIMYILSCIFYIGFIQKFIFVENFEYRFLIPLFKSAPDIIAIFVCYKFLKGSIRKWMLSATIACAAGDIFLGISRDTFYMAALGAYLLSHILFTICFGLYKKFSWKRAVPNIFIITYTIIIGIIVVPRCSTADAISVILYIIVITVMAILASFINLKKYYIIFFGASLFILSDSINALDKFVFSNEATLSIKENINKEPIRSERKNHRIFKLSITDSNVPSKVLLEVKFALLHLVVSLYYGALFFIVFGFVYAIRSEDTQNLYHKT